MLNASLKFWGFKNMENIEFFLSIGLLVFIIFIFIRISLRIRRSGGTMTTTVHGALDAFYDKDKKKAVEMVVEKQANKKLDEQSSSDPDNNK